MVYKALTLPLCNMIHTTIHLCFTSIFNRANTFKDAKSFFYLKKWCDFFSECWSWTGIVKSAALPNFIKTSVVKIGKKRKINDGRIYEPENRLLVLVYYFIQDQETPVHNNSSILATKEPSRKVNRIHLKLGTEDKQLIVLNEFNWHSFRHLFLFACLYLTAHWFINKKNSTHKCLPLWVFK